MSSLRILILLFLLLLTGCATGITVQIDSITGEATPSGMRYVLKSGAEDVREDDLYFVEFSRYFQTVLAEQGYQRVADIKEADLIIFFSYGVADGRTTQHIYSTPVYDWVGSETITHVETKEEPGGTTRTTRQVYIPSRQRLVGRDIQITNVTTYTSYASLVAKRQDDLKSPPLWRTFVQGASETNDLRSLMPVLAAAAAPYLGNNTGRAIKLKLREDDPRAEQLRQSLP